MLAGCRLLQRGRKWSWSRSCHHVVLFTRTRRWKISTQMCFAACSHVATFIWLHLLWQTTEWNEISVATHTFTRWRWAGSVTTGSRLEWHSIPHTAWGARHSDKNLESAHILYVHIIHSRHRELRQQQTQHTNKASITKTVESLVHRDGIDTVVLYFSNRHPCNVRLSAEAIGEVEQISRLLYPQTFWQLQGLRLLSQVRYSYLQSKAFLAVFSTVCLQWVNEAKQRLLQI